MFSMILHDVKRIYDFWIKFDVVDVVEQRANGGSSFEKPNTHHTKNTNREEKA